MRIPALAILATTAVLTALPAQAQTYGGNAPICLHKWYWGGSSTYYCEYASMAQCQATASGLPATCVENPYFAQRANVPGEPIGSRVAPTSVIAAPSNLCQMSTINTGSSVSGHVPPDLGEIGVAGAGLVDEFAVEHHHQTIRQFEQFVEVFADQQHRGAAVARRHDLGMDLGDGREIQPKAGIGGDQHLDLAAEFARQHRALHVAARQCRDRRIRRAGLDLVQPDLAFGVLAKRSAC